MHVLTLSGLTPAPDDFHWGEPGELAFPGLVCCSSAACGCNRAFAGIRSHKAGTVLRVVDAGPELSRDQMFQECRDGHDSAGWTELPDDAIEALVELNVSTAVQCSPGTLLRPTYIGGGVWEFTAVDDVA